MYVTEKFVKYFLSFRSFFYSHIFVFSKKVCCWKATNNDILLIVIFEFPVVSLAGRWYEPLACCNEISLRPNCRLLEARSKIYGSLVCLAKVLQKNTCFHVRMFSSHSTLGCYGSYMVENLPFSIFLVFLVVIRITDPCNVFLVTHTKE